MRYAKTRSKRTHASQELRLDSSQSMSVQRLQEWWTPFVIIDFAETAALNDALSAIILRKERECLAKSNSPKPFPQNFAAFSQLWDTQELLSWKGEAIHRFRKLLDKGTEAYWKFAAPAGRAFAPSKRTVWANVSRQADWHGYHSHYSGGTDTMSGVYWVKVPTLSRSSNQVDGHTIYYDPRGPFHPSRQKKVLEPTPGRMVIHPSWLPHSVAPVRASDAVRISIAFDIHCGGPL